MNENEEMVEERFEYETDLPGLDGSEVELLECLMTSDLNQKRSSGAALEVRRAQELLASDPSLIAERGDRDAFARQNPEKAGSWLCTTISPYVIAVILRARAGLPDIGFAEVLLDLVNVGLLLRPNPRKKDPDTGEPYLEFCIVNGELNVMKRLYPDVVSKRENRLPDAQNPSGTRGDVDMVNLLSRDINSGEFDMATVRKGYFDRDRGELVGTHSYVVFMPEGGPIEMADSYHERWNGRSPRDRHGPGTRDWLIRHAAYR